MTDLIGIMGSLVDTKGKILIPGVNDTVAPLTDEEQKLYEPIDFDPVSTSISAAHYSNLIPVLNQWDYQTSISYLSY